MNVCSTLNSFHNYRNRRLSKAFAACVNPLQNPVAPGDSCVDDA